MQSAVERLVEGRTVLVIAHRLSTVQVRLLLHLHLLPHSSSLQHNRGKGRPAVATRCSSHHVQAADQIAVLDAGRVVELGTHEELTARGGRYKELINSQSLSLSR